MTHEIHTGLGEVEFVTVTISADVDIHTDTVQLAVGSRRTVFAVGAHPTWLTPDLLTFSTDGKTATAKALIGNGHVNPIAGRYYMWWRVVDGVQTKIEPVKSTSFIVTDTGGSPLAAVPPWVASVTGPGVDNTDPLNPVISGDGGTGGRLLVGIVPPIDALPDPPTSGTWTWSNQSGAWFSPAYEVSWQAGDNTGAVPYVEGAGSGAVQPSTLVGAGPFASDQPAEGIPQFDWNAQAAPDGRVTTATQAGSGVVFLITEEEGFGGPTTPPRPDLDVLDYLGDLVLTNGTTPVPWAIDEGTGVDGDSYLLLDTRMFYGPRAGGTWPTGRALNDPTQALDVGASEDIPVLTGYAYPGGVADLAVLIDGSTPNKPVYRITSTGAVVTAGTEPADADLADGQLAWWFDPTAAAPVVQFKGKDAAGAVYVASLAMTPA